MSDTSPTLTIGIIGAGFSGTSLAAHLHQFAKHPLKLILFDKSGTFGPGIAYSTPSLFHLLNVRACEMSAYENQPNHFVTWLSKQSLPTDYLDAELPIEQCFAPRFLYGEYLKNLLHSLNSEDIQLTLVPSEIKKIINHPKNITLITHKNEAIEVDKVVFALGNNLPSPPPFPINTPEFYIDNPWDYAAFKNISRDDTVFIVGNGLSMIDSVLTLHHQKHRGKIITLSRHGLIPLPHNNCATPYSLSDSTLPYRLHQLSKILRKESASFENQGGDWRSVMHAFRLTAPALWEKLTLDDRKQFIRHSLPYWNIHRHRVHEKLYALIKTLTQSQQLQILSGRVLAFEKDKVIVKERHQEKSKSIPVNWLINCMGPSIYMTQQNQPLAYSLHDQKLASFDTLKLGFNTSRDSALINPNNEPSSRLFTLGPPSKGMTWEATAVGDIRKQAHKLARYLLDQP